MEGVTILNAYKALSDGSAVFLGFGVVIVISIIVAAVVFLHESYDRKDKVYAIALIASAFGLALILLFNIKPSQYYEVMLDESVKWQEFTTHYEVEKVRGQIITVREVINDDL